MKSTIPIFLNDTCIRFPDKVAFSDDQEEWRFRDVKKAADSIATVLVRKGYFKSPIAIMMKKSSAELVAFAGVFMSGNYYTVIDEKMPIERQKKILNKFEPDVIITDESTYGLVAENYGNSNVLLFSEMINYESDFRLIKRATEKIIDTDLLYVLFTSGSTGVPKGVTITHRSVIDYILWAKETFDFDENVVFGNQAPFYFDNSVLDIYTVMLCGATLHIIPKKMFSFPVTLIKFLIEKKVNTIFWVPTVLSRIANLNVLGRCEIPQLERVLFAGEVMPTRDLNIWKKNIPGAVYANLYGPTEITVDCTCYIVNREFDDNEPLPIGKRCGNTDVFLLDESLYPVKDGDIGEIVVRGTSLSLGYYNDTEITNKSFIQNPLNNKYHELVYRTGDLAHVNEYNELIFDGRRDFQIKHGGHRIELGEIENTVSAIASIMFNACVYDKELDRIVLFYQGNIAEKDIRIRLKNILPSYMLPYQIVKMEKMPLNGNDKIDRSVLENYLNNFKEE